MNRRLFAVSLIILTAISPAGEASSPYDGAYASGGCSDAMPGTFFGPVTHRCVTDQHAQRNGSIFVSVETRTRLEGRAHASGYGYSTAELTKSIPAPGVDGVRITVPLEVVTASRSAETGALSPYRNSGHVYASLPLANGCYWEDCRTTGGYATLVSEEHTAMPNDVVVLEAFVFTCDGRPIDSPITARPSISANGEHPLSQGAVKVEASVLAGPVGVEQVTPAKLEDLCENSF